jgi:C4-dicarboxylate-specific signal transduction histidine kinase
MMGSWLIDSIVSATQRREEENTLRVARAAVEAVRQRMDRTLEAAFALHEIGRRVRVERLADPRAAPLALEQDLMAVIAARRLDAMQLAIIDATGMLVWSSVPGFVPVDLSDREHFRVHRDGLRTPFVSEPLIGRVSGRKTIQFTKALVDDRDAFVGVAVVSMDPLAISADLGALDFGPGAVATVLRADGTVIARSVDALAHIGLAISDQDSRLLNSSAAGSAMTQSSLDGRRRLAAWQSIPLWSLVIAFSLDHAPIDEATTRLRSILYIVLLSLLASGGVGALLVFGSLDRNRERAEASLAEVAAREAAEILHAMPGAAYRGTITRDGSYQPLPFTHIKTPSNAWPRNTSTAEPGGDASEGAASTRSTFFREVFERSEAIREFEAQSTNGSWAWVREHCRIVRRGTADNAADVVGLIIDITEERRIKAQAIASSKLATLGEMATGVAHELNQPCASITLAADVASFELDRGTPADLASARRRLDDIAEQATRLREVIDHFQIFSRVPDGRAGAVSIRDAVSGALKISTGMLKAAGVHVEVSLPATLPRVHAELVPLEQVLVNLLVNARDAMRETTDAPKRIEIGAAHDGAAGQVVLTVRDHGHGVPASVADRLFEPFFTTKATGEGTGLGLAIAYGTLRGFGGGIDIRNHAGGGAVVTLHLKIQESNLPNLGGSMPESLVPVS